MNERLGFRVLYQLTAAVFVTLLIKPALGADWYIKAQTVNEQESIVETIASTLDHLRDSFPQDNFTLEYSDNKDFKKGFSPEKGHLFITDILTFTELSQKFGAWAVAAMKHPLAKDAAHSVGAVFITRTASNINGLKDLEDKTVVVADTSLSPSYLMGMRELQRYFGDNRVFKKVTFINKPVEQVVHEVIAGTAEVGIVDSCLIETMVERGNIPANSIKTVGAKSTTDLKCRHSTDLYPGWVLGSAYPRNQMSLGELQGINNLLVALTTVPQLFSTMEWTSPTDNSEILELQKSLNRQENSKRSLASLFYEFRYYFYGLALLLLCVLTHSLYAEWLVKRRTRQLKASMAEKARIEKVFSEEREKFALLEKAGVVSQMSSLIAHELQQPLNSIVNYARGLRVIADRGKLNDKSVHTVANEICDQGMLAAAIVNKVRGYAKNTEKTPESIELGGFLTNLVDKFKAVHDCKVPIELLGDKQLKIWMDPLELELLVVNMLRNSTEAQKDTERPKITIDVTKVDTKAEIVFSDNAPHLSAQAMQNLFKPGISTKKNGLGLGLSLCQKIAEANGGHLIARQDEAGKLFFVLTLPLKDGENQ